MNEARQAAELGAAAYGASKAGGAGAAVKYSLCGLILAAVSSASVVMSVTMPQNPRDFFASIMSTVISSMCGGAYVATKFGMLETLESAPNETARMFALAAIVGISFVCGLPAWAFVRGLFVWTESRKNKGIDVLIHDAKEAIK